MKTLTRYDVYATEGDYFGVPIAESVRSESPDGNWIRVEDLKEWLDWQLRERTIHTVYSDLTEQLK